MAVYRFTLEKYAGRKSRYKCPSCQKEGCFARYIDTSTNKHLAPSVGKCDRIVKCGYHLPPREHFQFNPQVDREWQRLPKPTKENRQRLVTPEPAIPQASSIPIEALQRSLMDFGSNCLVQYLAATVGVQAATKAIERYYIGSSSYWPGATVFWQIDIKGRVRAGKVMLYDAATGKRVKKPFNHINWVHSILKMEGFTLRQCLFGEHLLKPEPMMPVGIVESEKTAVLASIYMPEMLWLACGSLSSLTVERCEALKARKVVLFPDLGGFDKWQQKAKKLSSLAHVVVSDFLERAATDDEKRQGMDLADYLIRFPLSSFVAMPLELHTKDITSLRGRTVTGPEFSGLIIQGLATRDGKSYDLIFDRDEELLRPKDNDEVVGRLQRFFEKDLQMGALDGVPCYIHSYDNDAKPPQQPNKT